MGGGKGIADVLRGLVDGMPVLAWLVVALSAAFGIFLAGYALLRLYQANDAGDGTALNWLVAFLLGSALTCGTVVVSSLSFHFAE